MHSRRHATGRKGGGGRYIAATTLAQLGSCETRQVLDRQHGERVTPEVAQLREGGRRHHEAFHERASFAHNRRPEPVGVRRSDSRCFIASAVYGVNDPRTNELRRFRDAVLNRSRPGRWMVWCYYRMSPPIACWFQRDPVSARIARRVLDVIRIVATRSVPNDRAYPVP